MATLKDVITYICRSYPYADDLSKARLTKLIYLADWKMCISYGTQLTPTRWYFNHYGPYVPDVEQLARNNEAFFVDQTYNMFGSPKEVIRLSHPNAPYNLSPEERSVIDFTINNTQQLNWDDFIKLVYSTYPIITNNRYQNLDLPQIAAIYRQSDPTHS